MEPSWKEQLAGEFSKDYMRKLKAFLAQEIGSGKVIYPQGADIFNAFNTTPFDKVRVVMLGQDPYHGPGQAHGLCFSVKPGVPVPPSLVNIYKELATDVGCSTPGHGYLMHWAHQGVLLLNAVLTVERSQAGSHQGQGWERLTDQAVAALSASRSNLVFMLWGKYAQDKGAGIDARRHLVLRSTHPSPLSAHRGFLGCRHFSQANAYLQQHGIEPIDWQIPASTPLS